MAKYMKDSDWSKFKNFKKSEFKCKCKKKYCNEYPHEIAYSLVEILQKLRDHYGKAITITSGLRCKTHNEKVGGVKSSKHMTGQAADFYFSGMNKDEVIKWLKKQANYSYAYTNSTNMKGAVHIDTKLTTEPITSTVDRDINKDQLKVLATSLNVRTSASTSSESLGYAKKGGIYNYYDVKSDTKYTWYRIADDQWVAQTGNYLEIYPKYVEIPPIIDIIDEPIDEPKEENKELCDNNTINDVELCDNIVDRYEITEEGYYEIYLKKGEILQIIKKG